MYPYSPTYSAHSPSRASSVAFVVPSHMPASFAGSPHASSSPHRRSSVSTTSSLSPPPLSSPGLDHSTANPSASPPRNKLRKGKSVRRYTLEGVNEGADAGEEAAYGRGGKGKQRADASSHSSSASNLGLAPSHGFSFVVEEEVENSNFPYDLSGDKHPARQPPHHANVVGPMALEGRRVAVVEPSDGYASRGGQGPSQADAYASRGRQPAPASEEYESSSSLARRMSMGQQAEGITRRKRSLSFGRRKSGKKTREEAPPLPGPVPPSPRDPPEPIFPPHPAFSPPSRSPSRASGVSTPRSPYSPATSPMYSPSAASSNTSLARARSISRSPASPVPPLPSLVRPHDMYGDSQTNRDVSSPSGGSLLASSSQSVTRSCHSSPSIHVSSNHTFNTSSQSFYLPTPRSVSGSVLTQSSRDHSPNQPRRSFSANSHWNSTAELSETKSAKRNADPWEALSDAPYSPRRSTVQIRVDLAPSDSQVPAHHSDGAKDAQVPVAYSAQPTPTAHQSGEGYFDGTPSPGGSRSRRLTLSDQRASSRVSMAEQRVLGEDGEFKAAPRRLKRKHPPTASKTSLQRADTPPVPSITRRSSDKSKKGKDVEGSGYHEIQAGQEKPRRPSFLSRISDFARGKKKKSVAGPDAAVRANDALFVDDSAVLGGRMSLGEGYASSEPGHGPGGSWSSASKSRSVAGHGDEMAAALCSPTTTEEDGREWGTDIGHDACVSATVMEEEYRKLVEDRKWKMADGGEQGEARAAPSAETLRAKSVDTMRASSAHASSSMHTRSSETMRTNVLICPGASLPTISDDAGPCVKAGAPERLPAYEEVTAGLSSSPVSATSEGSSTPRSIAGHATPTSPTPTSSPVSRALPAPGFVTNQSNVNLDDRSSSVASGSSHYTPTHRRSYSDSDSWRAPSAALEDMLDQSLPSLQSRSGSRGSLDALRMLSPLPPSPSSSRSSKHISRKSTLSPTSSVSATGRTHNKLVKKSRRPSVHLLDTVMRPSQRSSTEPHSADSNPRSPSVWLNTPPTEHSATFGGIASVAHPFTALEHRDLALGSSESAESMRNMTVPALPAPDCQYCSPRDEREDAFSHLHVYPDRPDLRAQPSVSDMRSTRGMRRWTVSGLDQPRTPGERDSDESDWGESEHEEEEAKAAEVLTIAANKPLPSSSLFPPSPSMPSLAYFGHAADRLENNYFGMKDKSLPPTPAEPAEPKQRTDSLQAPRRPQLRPLSVMSPVPTIHGRQSVSSPPTRTRFGSMSGGPKIFEISNASDESSSDERDDHVFDQDDEPETATPGTSAGTSSLGHGQWEGVTRSASSKSKKAYSHLRVIPLPSDAAHTHLLHITTELLMTEKHYVSLLRLLLAPGSTQTPPPPLMRTYVQELVNVCDGLVRSIEGRSDLSDGGIRASSDVGADEGGSRRRGGEHKRPEPPNPAVACHALIALREDVEGAYVRWCGVVGGWFVGPSENGGASIGRAKRRLSKTLLAEGAKRRASIVEASEEPVAESEEVKEKEPQPAPEPGEGSQEGAAENVSAESGGERPSLASHKSAGRKTHVWRKSVPSLSALQMQLTSNARKEEPSGSEAREPGGAKGKENGPGKAPEGVPKLSRRERKERQRKLPTVRELAILPTQRVMRYVLLYRDLLAHTPQTSPIRPLVQSAVDVAASIAAKCDRAQDTAEFFHRAM
ncbi:hypothetical protein HDZ31DRAFT_27918 [Schizophyllum fasciatum]